MSIIGVAVLATGKGQGGYEKSPYLPLSIGVNLKLLFKR